MNAPSIVAGLLLDVVQKPAQARTRLLGCDTALEPAPVYG